MLLVGHGRPPSVCWRCWRCDSHVAGCTLARLRRLGRTVNLAIVQLATEPYRLALRGFFNQQLVGGALVVSVAALFAVVVGQTLYPSPKKVSTSYGFALFQISRQQPSELIKVIPSSFPSSTPGSSGA